MNPDMLWQPYLWQQVVWQQWQQRVQTNRVPHALLISGMPGTGKLALAKLIAAQQLCEQQRELPCQQCKSCLLFAAGSHPHLYDLSQALETHKLSVEVIREAIQFLTSTQVFSGPKIVILPEADTLSQASANALLKTLEEPLGQSLLILTTAELGRVLPTIRSRCQSIRLEATLTPALLTWLQTRFALTESQVKQRWFWSEGSPLRIDPDAIPDTMLSDFLSLGQGLQTCSPAALWALRSLTEKYNLNMLVLWWLRWIRLLTGPVVGVDAWPELHAVVLGGLPKALRAEVFTMVDSLQQLIHALMAGYQMNAALQFEALLYQWLMLNEVKVCV